MIKHNLMGRISKTIAGSVIVLSLVQLTCISLKAQNNTSSIYSMYNLGDLEPVGFGKTRAMGGVGFALTSKGFLNNTNPASYNGIDSVSNFVEFGVSGKSTQYESGGIHQSKKDANFQYLAMGFRLKRWWGASIGILPYSSVGYTVKTEKLADGSLQPYSVLFEGTGGMNQLYLGNSFKIADKLSLGINISYLFGPLNQAETYYLNNESVYSVITIRKYYLHRFYFDYGMQYSFKINDLDFSLGIVYSNKQFLKSDYKTSMYTADGDTLTMESNKIERFIIPGKFGIGLAIQKDNKLQLAADYSFQYWSQSKSLSESADLVNSQQINLGLEYCPNDRYKKNYLKHMKYRLGGYYNASYLELRKNQITKYGITFGFGLPIPRVRSVVNLSFELGQRGTEANNLIKEKYGIIHLGFTLHETWFIKPKFE